MKIAYITAGAGRMYCGSCLRDNSLAAELMALGHDVHLIPLYTPTRTDEPNVSQKRVFLGGINMYLQQNLSLFRKTPWYLDRLWDSPPVLKLAARLGIRLDPARLGAMTVSTLRGGNGYQGKEVRKLALFLEKEISPDIINLSNSLLIGLVPEIKSRTNAPVCVMLQGEDLFLKGLAEDYRNESLRLIRSHAGHVDAFLAVSDYCAEYMSKFLGIARGKIHVVPLGISMEDYSTKDDGSSEPFTIGYLARIAPEKGLHLLVDAYMQLRQRKTFPASRLWVAGYLAAEHKPYLKKIERKIVQSGLSDQFEYLGELDRNQKVDFLQKLSLFSVPSSYDEPKGMYVLEAMANAVPVVQPRSGSFPEIVRKTGGGILVRPNDAGSLADGILSLWEDPDRRANIGQKGFDGVRSHYSASKMAARALSIFEGLTTGPPSHSKKPNH